MSARSSSHDEFRHFYLTGWACRILRCDPASPPKACVLLVVSVVMMLVTFLSLSVLLVP